MIRVRVKSNDIAAFRARVRPGCERVVAQTSLELEAGAKHRSRYRSGTMRRGWHVRILDALHHIVANPVPYAPYHEHGTSKMSAQPMITPEVELARGRFLRRLRAVFRG